MKFRKLLFIALCVTAFSVNAQTYTFSASTATYTDLVGSTSLNGTATWDDPSYSIPIGFNFQYFSETLSTIYINDVAVGGGLSNTPNDFGVIALLQAYGADIIDRGYNFATDETPTGSQSNISYLLDGTAGSRVLKIEWNNVGFFGEVQQNGNANTDFTNFQLWLFEADNSIEIHFGPNSISNPNLAFDDETGTFVTLIEALDLDNETFGTNGALILTGTPSNPTLSTVTTVEQVDNAALDGIIPNGTVYRFENTPLSINEFETTTLNLFPNPSSDFITISGLKQQEEYNVFDITGRKISNGILNTTDTLNIQNLSIGLYVLQFKNGTALKFTKN